VVAVEREAVLAPVIQALAREAGVADRVEVVREDVRRVSLKREFDVIVGELVGNEAFDKGLVPLFERARERFLKRGGALVPEWVSLEAAPVRAHHGLGVVPGLVPSACVSELTTHLPRNVDARDVVHLSPGRPLLRVDLRRARKAERLPVASARFRVRDGALVSGIAVWATSGRGSAGEYSPFFAWGAVRAALRGRR
jgi:hypothetical protein